MAVFSAGGAKGIGLAGARRFGKLCDDGFLVGKTKRPLRSGGGSRSRGGLARSRGRRSGGVDDRRRDRLLWRPTVRDRLNKRSRLCAAEDGSRSKGSATRCRPTRRDRKSGV